MDQCNEVFTNQSYYLQVEPLDRAKFHLVAAYALNSLFWVYLNAIGENPREHSIKDELERIRGHMSKVKQIIDKAKAPRLNVNAAKRFVAGALWTPKETEGAGQDADQDEVAVVETVESGKQNISPKKKTSRKRRRR